MFKANNKDTRTTPMAPRRRQCTPTPMAPMAPPWVQKVISDLVTKFYQGICNFLDPNIDFSRNYEVFSKLKIFTRNLWLRISNCVFSALDRQKNSKSKTLVLVWPFEKTCFPRSFNLVQNKVITG